MKHHFAIFLLLPLISLFAADRNIASMKKFLDTNRVYLSGIIPADQVDRQVGALEKMQLDSTKYLSDCLGYFDAYGSPRATRKFPVLSDTLVGIFFLSQLLDMISGEKPVIADIEALSAKMQWMLDFNMAKKRPAAAVLGRYVLQHRQLFKEIGSKYLPVTVYLCSSDSAVRKICRDYVLQSNAVYPDRVLVGDSAALAEFPERCASARNEDMLCSLIDIARISGSPQLLGGVCCYFNDTSFSKNDLQVRSSILNALIRNDISNPLFREVAHLIDAGERNYCLSLRPVPAVHDRAYLDKVIWEMRHPVPDSLINYEPAHQLMEQVTVYMNERYGTHMVYLRTNPILRDRSIAR